MTRRRVAIASLMIAALCGGCSDKHDERPTETTDANAPINPGSLHCAAARPFTTAMGSCDEATALGQRLASEIVGVTPEGADLIFSGICSAIQGDETSGYNVPELLDLAVALNAQGVCPGDVAMLVPI